MAILALTLLLGVCECPTETIAERIERSNVIFEGELSNLSEDLAGCNETGQWNHSILVKKVYKGSLVERVVVQSLAPDKSPCGIKPHREGNILFYATKSDGYRVYQTDLCMGTKPVQEADDDFAELGEGTLPDDVGGCLAAPPTAAVLWLLLVGFVIRRHNRSSRRSRQR